VMERIIELLPESVRTPQSPTEEQIRIASPEPKADG
jgi:hypothetical protein